MTILTLNTIKEQSPCISGWSTLLKSLNKTSADDTNVTISNLLASNGIKDTLWVIYNCLKVLPDFDNRHKNMTLDLAESVICNYEKQFPQDSRVRDCIAIVRNSNCSIEELHSAA